MVHIEYWGVDAILKMNSLHSDQCLGYHLLSIVLRGLDF